MDEPTSNSKLPPAVRRVLDTARRQLRAYVWLEGIAVLVAAIGAAFWIGLLFDWFFEPSRTVRWIALLAVGGVLAFVVYRYLLRRVFVSVPDESLALLLERRFPELNERLLTAVHIASGRADVPYRAGLVAETQHRAVRAVADVEPARVFRWAPLATKGLAAAALAISILVFALAAREVFAFYLDRLALAPEGWPRRVELEVVGFPANSSGNRVHRLAQDDDYELIVRARAKDRKFPEQVEIRYELADGGRGRDTLIRVGDAAASDDEYQVYRYEFDRVAGDLTFDVVGGDDRVENLAIEVVDRPQLFSIELDCRYPEYLGRAATRLPVTGGMRIPEGADLALHAQSTKALAEVRIRRATQGDETRLQLAEKTNELTWDYGTLIADDVLLVTVTDIDGVSNRDPYRISLSMVPDEVPQVAVRLRGVGSAVTPQATIPVVGKVTDEYGLNRLWYESQIDDGPVSKKELGSVEPSALSVNQFASIDLREVDSTSGERLIAATPGQKLKLSLRATDRYDLADVPRDGTSQQFVLDVVTDADLLALLERRELELRQRYEAIYEKVTDTRNLLARVDFREGSSAEVEAEAGPMGVGEAAASEGGVEADASRALARRRLRVSGAEQNVTQAADEILDVAEGFDDIHEQLTNNRIDNADLKSRLREQIALPLHAIGSSRMPELRGRLKLVEEHIEDTSRGEEELATSLALADSILVDMKQVLDRMLELETYNEVVALLRDIIKDQEALNERTKERQKERLKILLDD